MSRVESSLLSVPGARLLCWGKLATLFSGHVNVGKKFYTEIGIGLGYGYDTTDICKVDGVNICGSVTYKGKKEERIHGCLAGGNRCGDKVTGRGMGLVSSVVGER